MEQVQVQFPAPHIEDTGMLTGDRKRCRTITALGTAAVVLAAGSMFVFTNHRDVFVRASADATNAQTVIDSGGEVAVRYTPTSGVVVSAHNFYDPTALFLSVGDTVTFTGELTGTYRVTGTKDVVQGEGTVADLASLNAPVMMQTCWLHSSHRMRLVGMVPD
jgi:hypothetical protein